MKIRPTLIICFLFLAIQQTWGQNSGSISGRVSGNKVKEPIGGTLIVIKDYNRWAVTDKNGEFSIADIPYGKVNVEASCLGYETGVYEIEVAADTVKVEFILRERNLALDEVTVLARRDTDDATTTYIIDRIAVEHMQILSINDVAALLPGGQLNRSNNLISSQYFNLRRGMGSELGSSTSGFGTAVEVDGVRLSNNASMSSFSTNSTAYGADVRTISTSNVESVEIITGVTSVEYGDLQSGVVKINTTKGRTPYFVDFVTKPHTKQYSIGKGFDMGNDAGILNVNLERAESVSDLASPYTTYDRNVLSLNYSNTFNRSSRSPMRLNAGVTGNLGGYDSSADPDLYRDTYSKISHNSLRANVGIDWQLNRKWLTNLEASASVNYVEKRSEESSYKSAAGYTAALHGTEEGYYSAGDPELVLIPPGTWYQIMYEDSRQLTLSAKVKGTWVRRLGKVNNRIMVGAEYSADGNNGRGVYYDDMALAPTWREQRYSDLPYFRNLAVYGEENITIPLGSTTLRLTAGLRSEWMTAKGSIYGTVNSLSPRFNLKYDIPFSEGLVEYVTLRAGYGKAVKLPSFSVLYPTPTYTDLVVFDPLYAYYTYPLSSAANPDLRWQYDRLHEIGADAAVGGVKLSLTFFYNKTVDRYASKSVYTPLTYYYTSVPNDNTFPIASADRIYAIDRVTGVVTVSDRTGAVADIELPQTAKDIYRSTSSRTNASPVTRKGLEWVIDFGRIEPIGTSFRLDGKYYVYKGIDETIYATTFSELASGPHPFIGYYVGSTNSAYNGSTSKNLNLNLTVSTHIPRARLIFSLRVESTLYLMKQNLSEFNGSPLAFVLDSSDSYHPSATQTDIYAGNQFVGVYPLYYSTHDDPNTLIPFAEMFEWARDNDRDLYNLLAVMVKKTNYNYTFNRETVSPYFSASIAVTKEIGKIASLTFNANNFFNNTSRVRNTWTNTESTLFGSSYIPALYYGLSLRLRF